MRYAIGLLAFGLVFSAPGWAVAVANVGEPAMWAGLGAAMLVYAPFMTMAFFPSLIQEVVSEH
jgi:hypothetical protein